MTRASAYRNAVSIGVIPGAALTVTTVTPPSVVTVMLLFPPGKDPDCPIVS